MNTTIPAGITYAAGGYHLQLEEPPKNHSLLNADNLTLLTKIIWYSTIALCFAFNGWVGYVFIEYRIFGGVS